MERPAASEPDAPPNPDPFADTIPDHAIRWRDAEVTSSPVRWRSVEAQPISLEDDTLVIQPDPPTVVQPTVAQPGSVGAGETAPPTQVLPAVEIDEPHPAAELTSRRCLACRAKVGERAKYCNNCGAPLAPPAELFATPETRPDRLLPVAAVLSILILVFALVLIAWQNRSADDVQGATAPTTASSPAPGVGATPAPTVTAADDGNSTDVTTVPTTQPARVVTTTAAPAPPPPTAAAGQQHVSDPSGLPSGYAVRIASAQAGSDVERNDIFELEAAARQQFPSAAVYSADAIAPRASLGSGLLVLYVSVTDDAASAQRLCSTMPGELRAHGCLVDRIG